MRRLLPFALLAAALAPVIAVAAPHPKAQPAAAAAAPKSLLAIRWQHEEGLLVRLDGRTLRPAGRTLPLGRFTSSSSFSPDPPARPRPRTADRTPLRRTDDASPQLRPAAARIGLRDRNRLADRAAALALVSIDDARHRLSSSTRPRAGSSRADDRRADRAGRPRPRRLLLLLAPADRIGAARLLAVGPDGSIETAPLPRTLAGSRKTAGARCCTAACPARRRRLRRPRLRARRRRAGRRGRAETMHVSYRQTHVQRSLASRLAAWLFPPAEAKGIVGPQRQALWLGDGLLALTGVDDQTSIDAKGNWHYRFDPAGLTLIDTRSWTARTIDDRVTTAWRLGPTLLALHSTPAAARRRSSATTEAASGSTRRACRRTASSIPPVATPTSRRQRQPARAARRPHRHDPRPRPRSRPDAARRRRDRRPA